MGINSVFTLASWVPCAILVCLEAGRYSHFQPRLSLTLNLASNSLSLHLVQFLSGIQESYQSRELTVWFSSGVELTLSTSTGCC